MKVGCELKRKFGFVVTAPHYPAPNVSGDRSVK